MATATAAPKAAPVPARKTPTAQAAAKALATVKLPAKPAAKNAKPAAPAKAAGGKAAKAEKPAKAAKAAKTAKENVKADKADKADKARKPKLVRDSFTIPKTEYAVLDALKQRAAKAGAPAKKSELLRAGIKALAGLDDAAFAAALAAVPAVKTGRPAKSA
jgi:Ca2+-dependent lipid-binding protein